MSRVQRTLLVVGAVCLAAVLILAGLFSPLADVMRRATLPAVEFVSGAAVSLGQRFNFLATRASAQQLFDAERRISQLTVDYARLQALEQENATLRAQAKFLGTSGFDSVGARVISRQIGPQNALLLIDRGLNDHVEIGQAVVTDAGVFIGKIRTITERVATVELITDPQSRVAASIAGQNRLTGVIEGRGNGAAVLNYIPSTESLARDQIVVTAGTEEKVPGNLPLGIINDVAGKQTDPFLTAAVEPIIPGDRVVFVSVLRPTALGPAL